VTDSAVATYDSASAGVGKSVSVTGLSLSGADAGRYEIGSVLLLSGDISKKSLTVGSVSVGEKMYDGSVIAPLEWSGHSLSGYVNAEGSEEARVGTPYARGKYQDAWVGSNKSVIGWFELPVLVGSGKDNYRLVFPTNLSGTIVKGLVVPEVGGLEGVYDGGRHEVVVKAIVNGSNLAVVTKYWGLSNTVYPTNEVGPIGAGSYGVEVKVAESEQNYGGGTNVVLRIGKKGAVIAAGSDTIRAGTVFNSNNYSSSGFLSSDVPSGNLVTLRSGSNSNLPVSYQSSSSQGGVYRILRGSVGDNVSQNYEIEYREGTLTVLKDSVMTEGTVVPLGAGSGFTLMVMSNRSVTNWGSTLLGVVPDVVSPGKVGTGGFMGAMGVGAGAGSQFGMSWTVDGQAVVWGATSNNPAVTQRPTNLSGLVGMSGGVEHVVYHREEGSNRVAGAWGTSGSGQTSVPGVLSGSGAGVVGVSAGQNFGLAVRTNGQVLAWGSPVGGVTTVPVGVSNVVGLAAGTYHGVGLKSDGTVAVWGFPAGVTNVPGELTNRSSNNFVRAVAVAAGGEGVLVLRADGSLRGWGASSQSWATNLPLALSNNPWVSVSASSTHAVGMRQDGTVVVWGNTNGSITNVAGLRGLVPMGGADSDGDGWANEAELRVGSDPLSRTSQPVKASFGVTFNYGSGRSIFETSRVVEEGSNRVVGPLRILDTMGRLEDGNQTEMSVELGLEAQKRFELVGRELRFKSSPVYGSTENSYPVDVIVKDSSSSAALTTTLTVSVGNIAPRITGNTTFAVDENVVVGSGVGTVQASEGSVNWSITSGNELGLFAIDEQSGQIKTARAIDYEALSNKTVTLVVRVTDAGGLSGSANIAITVRDVYEGMTPELWLPGSGVTLTSELLLKYAVGGALSATGSSENTVTVLDNNKLTLTAVIRTNDPSLNVVGEAGANLTNWSTNGVSVVPASQASVPEGCERRIYSVDRVNSPSRQFLRLKVTR
jgi:hypothetical protein